MVMDVLHLIGQETRRRGYSPRTAKAYCYCVCGFMGWLKKEPRKATRGDIQGYIDYLLSKDVSGSTINLHLNAVKFLMQEILRKRILLRIRFSKIPKKLPVVLSKEEVKRLIDIIENPTHRLLVELMYSAGLRVSEAIALRAKDITLENNLGWVRHGKGGKDRFFLIADRIKEPLKSHMNTYCASENDWLFPGRKGRHIHIRSPQEIVKYAARKAGINKDAHCHTLRHSFATHLIEDGHSIMAVQQLLGHSDPNTTIVYIHIASPKMLGVKSPYDSP